MDEFLKYFMSNAGPETISQLTKQLGISKSAAKQIVPQVIPMILGGLKKQKDERGGEARVDKILNKYGSADALKDITGVLASKAKDEKPDPALGGLLGNSGIQASKMFSKNFKLDPDLAKRIIPMLSPIILGSLTKKRDAEGAGSRGIASLLDADGDGSILDDVAGFLGKGMKKNNLIGGLLGGLLKK